MLSFKSNRNSSKRVFHKLKSNSTNSPEASNFQRLKHNSANNEKRDPSQSRQIVMLQYGGAETNIKEWCDQLEIRLLAKYGKVAQFIRTDEYYVPTAFEDVETAYDDHTDPGSILRMRQKNALSELAKEQTSVLQSYSKI